MENVQPTINPKTELPVPHDMQLPMAHWQKLPSPKKSHHIVLIFSITLLILSILIGGFLVANNSLSSSKKTANIPSVAPTPDTVNPAWVAFNDGNIRFSYPATWKVQEEFPAQTFSDTAASTESIEKKISVMEKTPSQVKGALEITIYPNAKNGTLKTWDKTLTSLLKTDNTTVVLSQNGNTFSGYPAYHYVVTTNEGSHSAILSIVNQKVYYLQAYKGHKTDSDYAVHNETYKKIIDSMNILIKPQAQICGGIANITCPQGYSCQMTAKYPDASGTCIPEKETKPIGIYPAPVLQAQSTLAVAEKISVDQVSIISYEETEWSDSSLGCPQKDMMYMQVITPGYRVVLQAKGKSFIYHTDMRNTVILCNGAKGSTSSDGMTQPGDSSREF